MKFVPVALAAILASASAFTTPSFVTRASSKSAMSMVLEKPATKKISKLETLKVVSENLIHPLKEVRKKRMFKNRQFKR
jgi:hypothetical protein